MSDLQDLIHRNAQLAYEQGAARERERIVQLLESNATGEYKQVMLTPKLISEIKGQQK